MTRIDGPGSVPPKPDPKKPAGQGGAAFDAELAKKLEPKCEEKRVDDKKKALARPASGPVPDMSDFLARLRENEDSTKQSVDDGEPRGASLSATHDEKVTDDATTGQDRSSDHDPSNLDSDHAPREAERLDDRAAAAAAAQGTLPPTPVDVNAVQKTGLAGRVPPQVLHRMVESIRVQSTREGGKEMLLELRGGPGYEGMGLKVTSQDGKISALFVVDQLMAKEAIEKSIPEMIGRLEAQGLTVTEIKVEVRGESRDFGGMADGERGREQRDRPHGDTSDAVPGDGSTSAPGEARPAQGGESSTEYTV